VLPYLFFFLEKKKDQLYAHLYDVTFIFSMFLAVLEFMGF
jgi:hypothetical protein